LAIKPEEIEGVGFQTALRAGGEFGLKLGEVCPALVDHDDLTVDDGRGDVEGADDRGKAFGAVPCG
jgi:hypothetical protein